jgi:hypothetical protein
MVSFAHHPSTPRVSCAEELLTDHTEVQDARESSRAYAIGDEDDGSRVSRFCLDSVSEPMFVLCGELRWQVKIFRSVVKMQRRHSR